MTSRLLLHDIPVRALSLARRVADIAAAMELPAAKRETVLEGLSPHVHDKAHLVLTGQYSSGKSLLIRAITDGEADVVVDSDIATDEVSEHDWGGVLTLVDTPGVQAGVERHDAAAERALAEADLVLFTVTVDLFDDSLASHLRHVAFDLGKRDQMLVAVTMAGKMTADEGIRESSLRDALGTAETPPLVECDARQYLKSREQPDGERPAALRQASGLDALRETLNILSRDRGKLGRYRQPLQNISSVVDVLLPETTENPHEKAALEVLARQSRALSAHRQRVLDGIDIAEQDFIGAALIAGAAFADAVEVVDEAAEELRVAEIGAAQGIFEERLTRASAKFADAVRRVVSTEVADLRVEMAEIGSGPQAQWLVDVQPKSPPKAKLRPWRASPGTQAEASQSVWLETARAHLANFERLWGGSGTLRDVSGSFGHEAVLEVGHMFGKKFRPWEAVKTARAVGRAMRVAGIAIQVGVAVTDVYQAERAARQAEVERHARRSRLMDGIRAQADAIVGDANLQVWAVLDPLFAEAERDIEAVRTAILTSQEVRTGARAQLVAIDREISLLLERL